MSEDDQAPIGRDADICHILTSLPQKFIVDFANGIDVTRDHLRVQRNRQGMFPRFYDGFTGKGSRRQAEINASLADGVEASLKWLCELTEELAHSNFAIAQVNDRVSALTGNVAVLAQYSADTRRRLEQLALSMDARSQVLEQEVARIGLIQTVNNHMNQVFLKWKAGRFGALSPAGRCYAALEELRWGPFGNYCRTETGQQRKDFVRQVIDRSIACLAEDAAAGTGERLGMRDRWLALPPRQSAESDMVQALTYLSDGFDAETAPFVTSISRAPQELPLTLPRLGSATRIAEALVKEVFTETSDA